MATILQHFQKVTLKEEARWRPQQLLAVAKRWTGHMDGLLANHMPDACIVVSVLKEVALYAGVQQVGRAGVEVCDGGGCDQRSLLSSRPSS